MIRVVGIRTRAAIIRSRRITGLTPDVIAELVAKIDPLWHERHQAVLASRPRSRAVGTGAKHKLVFVDRLMAALVHLRHGATHDMVACWFGVDRSTIKRAIGEVRPLLAERGCTVAPDIQLTTFAEVVDHLGPRGQTGIIDGTEVRVRRPAAGRNTPANPQPSTRYRQPFTSSLPEHSRKPGARGHSAGAASRVASRRPARQEGNVLARFAAMIAP
ncbi:transposase family protein [Streptomyces anulatus]|uniref:helix-turn-helix domain-containing protein n=1 Tax=Streptomyces anulatus TaxID=1892 RepID=UPI003870C89A|nr:transposase family protein [Streptomyces anulatus]